MACSAQGTPAQGKGIHPPARSVERRTSRAPLGQGGKELRVRRPRRQGDTRRSVRWTQPACHQALHVRPRLDRRLRRLLVRSGPGPGSADASPPPQRVLCRSLACAVGKDRSVQAAYPAGRSSGCRRTATTSTSTSTCRSHRRRSPTARRTTTIGMAPA